jgi:hypothetical protein
LKKSSLSKLISSFLAFNDFTSGAYLPILNMPIPADYYLISAVPCALTSSCLTGGDAFMLCAWGFELPNVKL